MSEQQVDGRLRWILALPSGGGDINLDRFARRLDETRIAVVVGRDAAASVDAQTTALTAVNLLSRLFRRLTIIVPDAAAVDDRVPFIDGALGPALVRFASRVCADVAAELAAAPPPDAIVLHVADPQPPVHDREVYCLGAGWLARVARHPVGILSESPGNPVGPLVAAALGTAEVFKLVFGDAVSGIVPAEDLAFSALTYKVGQHETGPRLSDVTLADTTLVGAGSVGSAFLWGLSHLRAARGILTIVDHDKLETHNPDRAILILDAAATAAPKKAAWARDMVQPWLPGVTVNPFEGTIREYVDSLPPDYRLPLAVSAVDSVESRRDIQDALPARILNASTGPTSIEVSSHHGFGDDSPCLYCLYVPDVLNRSAIHIAMEITGFQRERDVAELMLPGGVRTLTDGNVRGIERHNGLRERSLQQFVGKRLPVLLDKLRYSQAPARLGNDQALITTAFVSALAGFLLLAETLKEADHGLATYRLRGIYEQELRTKPDEFLYPGERDETGYCLCRSPARRHLYDEKYGRRGHRH